ncbi:MAG TPA: matrixin family metalloprotease [Candidatus Polarisedimenticolaceae bacterium]|nr:matrixin family metalloprotease [Candidatus Polarisedimenticolaceae bacterium]
MNATVRRAVLVIAMTLPCLRAARAASSVYLPLDRLAAAATLVVEGQVVRTASGLDPAMGALATYVTIDVSFVHRGPATLTRIVVREPGGHVGDLVNAIDAVPVFEAGENVLLFLEPARDRALRVAGLFFGKFTLVETAWGGRAARRDLSGQGLIFGRAPAETEEFPASEIESLVAAVPGRSARDWSAVPPELDRLVWDDVREASSTVIGGKAPVASGPSADFTTMSTNYPVRWMESDSATPVSINIQPGGNPLNDDVAAVGAIRRGMAAWTNVPEARIVLQSGNESYAFTASNAQSPTTVMPPVNIILFGDPYNEITDPSGCTGTLAMGGYWRSGTGTKTVNGVTFYPTLRQYVVFNNNFQCFLGNADNLAEVAAHELGHGLGFGHSTVADAIMRATAYGNGRGPRLGDDDRDAAHCDYPHTLTLTSPNGGESWSANTVHAVTWTATAEVGPDPGTVDIELSQDGGTTWTPIATGEPNDGSFAWTIGVAPGTQNLVRVIRHNRVSPTPAPYPEACSQDASDGVFTIAAPQPVAGCVPDGSNGPALRIDRGSGGALVLTWGASCSSGATNYAVYQGTLAALRSGTWDHAPVTCAGGTDLTETIVPGAVSAYYLVAPTASGQEGILGNLSSGAPRPSSTAACAPREPSSCP